MKKDYETYVTTLSEQIFALWRYQKEKRRKQPLRNYSMK